MPTDSIRVRSGEPSPRNLTVFLNRAQLARVTGVRQEKVYRAFAAGELTPNAMDGFGDPLFFMEALPALKAALEKSNAQITAETPAE